MVYTHTESNVNIRNHILLICSIPTGEIRCESMSQISNGL